MKETVRLVETLTSLFDCFLIWFLAIRRSSISMLLFMLLSSLFNNLLMNLVILLVLEFVKDRKLFCFEKRKVEVEANEYNQDC